MKTLLFKPFDRYQEITLLSIGGLTLVISAYVASITNVRFDGALDVHLMPSSNLNLVLKDLLISAPSLLLCLFAVGKIVNTKTRFIDLVALVLVARMPLYLLLFFNINNFMSKNTQQVLEMQQSSSIESLESNSLFVVVGFGILSVAFVVWCFTLLWNGFKTATNAKGAKPIWLFIIGIIVAEIISKVLLNWL